ncbi:MAG: cadherin-like domain-containing protein, partial [Thermoplasmata archaeon]|nr:cadherin-like domain-containing protein [Thermoplasmata archaeon]
DIKYKLLSDNPWIHIPNKDFKNGLWESGFAPSKFIDLGWYIFNITCNDTDIEVYEEFYLRVRNNLPTPPEVSIYPFEPRTLDDLLVDAKTAFDIETPQANLKYWYRWYKDNFFMNEFENNTIIPHTVTTKGETWRCVVFVHDGDELGPSRLAITKILNSPPELVEQFNSYEMFEDIPAILENKLTSIFTDADKDILLFTTTASEQDNITVEIIQSNGTIIFTPRENWFGTQVITFYANDSSPIQAEETVFVTVRPVNDLPEITQVGAQYTYRENTELEFSVNQDEWLNLSVIVEDIDGDVARGLISYFINITERQYLHFLVEEKKLVFHPLNEDV